MLDMAAVSAFFALLPPRLQKGIKSASVHHHFPTKATMAAAVAQRYADRFFTARRAAAEGDCRRRYRRLPVNLQSSPRSRWPNVPLRCARC